MKILFLASNPTTTDHVLLLDEEVRAIDEKIARSAGRDSVQVVSKWAVRPDDLHQAFLDHMPTIVHFSGHGAGQPLKGNIRVVVLNACESAAQAVEIAEVIDFVIGMDDTVDDETARRFAAAFYLGIASAQSIGIAFQMGISSVKLHGLPDDHVPQLYVRPHASADEVLVQKILPLQRK